MALVYDAGAFIAAERNVRPLWALHDAALRRDVSPLVPAVVLAQVWRGGPQPNVSRLLAGSSVSPLTDRLARAAGTLCGEAGTSDVIDASVVVLAHMAAAPVVTGDPGDLAALASAAGWSIRLHQI